MWLMYEITSICKRGATIMNSSLIRIHLIFILLVILFIPNLVSAESKTFIKEYTYHAGDEDSRNSSRIIALREIKRLLLEELGIYLESQTEIQNFQMTKDQITTLTAGIVSAERIEETWDGKVYWLKAKIAADPQDVVDKVNSLHKDLQNARELEEARKMLKEQFAEIEKLKNELKTDPTNEKKIAQYMKAIEGMNAVEMFRKGIELSISGKLPEAINELTDAIHKNPQYALAYAIRGHLYTKLGKNDNAIEDSNKAIELDPNSAFAYVGRSYIYFRLRDYEKGLIDANRAIELDPNYSYAYVIRGALFSCIRNHERQMEDAEKAIKLSPDNALAYLCRSDAHFGLGNKIRAYLDMKKAINLDPDSAEVYNVRGLFEYTQGNYEEALDYTNRAIKLDPYNAQAYHNIGVLYLRKKDYSQAVIELNRAIDIAPKYSHAYANRGIAYFPLGNYKQTISDLNTAIKLDPNDDKINTVLYVVLGNAHYKIGNEEQAIRDWKSAAKLGNKSAQTLLNKKGIEW